MVTEIKNAETEKIEEKPYTFRKLNATDMMPMMKIIGKIGIDEFSKCFNSDEVLELLKAKDTSKVTETVGIKIFLDAANVILNHIPDCEKEIFSLLASVSGLTIDEVKSLDFIIFTRMIIEFFKKEEFKDFIGVVSELLSK